MHHDLHGAIPGHEAAEVASWDAQADIEHALIHNIETMFAAVDYFKYFDSFDHKWVHGFLCYIGFPAALADMVLDLYLHLQRRIKLGHPLAQYALYKVNYWLPPTEM